jgi:D-alanine-D-alanine ligase
VVSQKLKVAVLFGGVSSEREISLVTGEAVAEALDARGHAVRMVDIRSRTLDEMNGVTCDLAFIALHGAFGEDGEVQRLLEERGIAYTGSGVEASRVAMDKEASKRRFVEHEIPTPDYCVLSADSRAETLRAAVVRLGFPQIIKPVSEGSSVGVSSVNSVPEARVAIEKCLALDNRVLVEQKIRGRELTVGVLGHGTLPIIELDYPTPIFDMEAKYTPGLTRHIVNPDLPEGVTEEVSTLALLAHQALGCRDISRVDFMLDERHQPTVLEVNTIPGMTPTSLVPDAAQAAGIPFEELVESIAWRAVRRSRFQRQQQPHPGVNEWRLEERP